MEVKTSSPKLRKNLQRPVEDPEIDFPNGNCTWLSGFQAGQQYASAIHNVAEIKLLALAQRKAGSLRGAGVGQSPN